MRLLPCTNRRLRLGERILNHLILLLRADFKHRAEYKQVYRKDSFDKWDLAINTLEAWEVLLPAAATEFRSLRDRRNDAIHFRPDVDNNDRALALAAIKSLTAIVEHQFAAFGLHPWFITGIPGENYIKKEWEAKPFIREVYLPNCIAVGPNHSVESVNPFVIRDDTVYEDRDVTDEEFCSLRTGGKSS